MSEPESVGSVRAAVAAALRRPADGSGPLERVCRAAVELLPVDGVSISVMSGKQHRETLYASDDVIARIESVQFTLGEGPCYEAFESGSPVLVPDLAQAAVAAWPVFASTIADQPVGAVFAFPIQSGAIDIGAMDMYRAEVGPLRVDELAIALQVVDVAGSVLLGIRHGVPADEFDEGWLEALPQNRQEVHQATGMLVAQLGVPADQALARLRGHAFAAGRMIEDVARDIVTRRLRLDDGAET